MKRFNEFNNKDSIILKYSMAPVLIMGAMFVFLAFLFVVANGPDTANPNLPEDYAFVGSEQSAPNSDGNTNSGYKVVQTGSTHVEDGETVTDHYNLLMKDENGDGNYEVISSERLMLSELQESND